MVRDLWMGRLIRLRALTPDDAAVLVEQSRDSEAQLLAGGAVQYPVSIESARRWIDEEASKPPDNPEPQLLIETAAGEVAGAIHPHHADPRHGTFSYAITVFHDHARKGYASEAITLVLRHFFEERRYQKCTVSAYAFNRPSLDLHHKLGFVEEGRLRRMVYAHGTHHDEVFLGITAEEFAQGDGAAVRS